MKAGQSDTPPKEWSIQLQRNYVAIRVDKLVTFLEEIKAEASTSKDLDELKKLNELIQQAHEELYAYYYRED